MENSLCRQCPRACGTDRAGGQTGLCGVPWTFRIARAAKHYWEEPPISGKAGSGTVFFSGCNLRCVFCQNREISREGFGRDVTSDELEEIFLRLASEGAANVNLVTPTHYALQLAPLLERVRPKLAIPIVYNCGGYESVETLRRLDGLIDVYLPDCKYHSPDLAFSCSGARDYPTVAPDAISEMLRQVGAPVFGDDGMMKKGVIVRHLVLPGQRKDSIAVLRSLAERFGTDAFLISLMRQYTPAFAMDCADPALHRRVTSFEYESVVEEADRLGFRGFTQEKGSADAAFTPNFHEKTF